MPYTRSFSSIDKSSDGSYRVYETLKFGFIPVSFAYRVTIESRLLENIVIMRTTVMKSTKIEMVFELKADDGFTVVEENIVFKSPWPVVSILEMIFKKQHRQLFKNIEMANK